MNLLKRRATVYLAASFLVLAAAVIAPGATAQGQQWQFVRADYGFRSQRTDVTQLVRTLVARGGMNGRIAVNNQTMGGDPAPGADKVLRIFARDDRNQDREFDFAEGSFVVASMFFVRDDDRDRFHGDGDHGDGDHSDADRDHDDHPALGIVRGYYGAQGRMVNVTDVLQKMVRGGSLTVPASNGAMGIDPAPGADKILIVVYEFRGREQAAAASEGHLLSIP
jgi:hypothetical protein